MKLNIKKIASALIVILVTCSFSNAQSSPGEKECEFAKKYKAIAHEYCDAESWARSANAFQKGYNICPGVFDCHDLYVMGSAYLYSENYQQAIKYSEKASLCEKDKEMLCIIFINLGDAYHGTGDTKNSVINFQKAITYATDNIHLEYGYNSIGGIYTEQEKFDDALVNLKKATDYCLKELSVTENDVKLGKVDNAILGESFWNLGVCYANLLQMEKVNYYNVLSAKCGYDKARKYCKEFNLTF